jgi:archaellum component FlaC
MENERMDAKQLERVSHLERQMSRLTELDTKLDGVQTDFGRLLNIFENRMVETVKDHIESSKTAMDNLNTNMAKLMSVVNNVVNSSRDCIH